VSKFMVQVAFEAAGPAEGPTTTFEVALCALRRSGSSPGGRQPSGFVATSSLVLMTLWLC
jgi:hypothetical protein